jgi:SAM-dependent methyltransferase
VKAAAKLLDWTLPYRLWQAPMADRKLAPLFAHNDVRAVRRVLDVGCGPGTNTRHFAHADYLGIDCNPRYIAYARRRYGRAFVVADATDYAAPADARFDCILVNSLLHHLDATGARRVLSRLEGLVSADGHVHILDLVLPRRRSAARLLARWDRGEFPRPLDDWHAMFTEPFEPVVFEPYALTALGVTLWHMVYFKGRLRR